MAAPGPSDYYGESLTLLTHSVNLGAFHRFTVVLTWTRCSHSKMSRIPFNAFTGCLSPAIPMIVRLYSAKSNAFSILTITHIGQYPTNPRCRLYSTPFK